MSIKHKTIMVHELNMTYHCFIIFNKYTITIAVKHGIPMVYQSNTKYYCYMFNWYTITPLIKHDTIMVYQLNVITKMVLHYKCHIKSHKVFTAVHHKIQISHHNISYVSHHESAGIFFTRYTYFTYSYCYIQYGIHWLTRLFTKSYRQQKALTWIYILLASYEFFL